MPKCSATTAVVIRSHNHGAFLPEAIASVRQQTRPVDEIVVLDDGSEDETTEILRDLASVREDFRVIRNEVAQGPARAFNDAAAATTADFILPLDADDRLSERFVEACAGALLHTGADIAFPPAILFGAVDDYWPSKPVRLHDMAVENVMHVSCMFRRWIFEETGGFSEEFDRLGLEDWDFWLAAMEAGARVTPVDGCALEYRRSLSGGRNQFRRATALRAHLLVYRRHPSVRRVSLMRWAARSVARNAVPRIRGRAQRSNGGTCL